MLDAILDAAGQKGTGRWTVIEAQKLAVAVPVIEAAVVGRNLSARVEDRAKGAETFGALPQSLPDGALDTDTLEAALIAGKILAARRLRDACPRLVGIRLGSANGRDRPDLARGLHHSLGHAQ